MVILQQLLIFFLMMLVGIVARKKGMITKENQRQLSGIVVNIANPAMIVSGSLGDIKGMQGKDFIIYIGIVISIFGFMILVAQVLSKTLTRIREDRPIIQLMLVFSNVGFMGMPMVSSLYGSEGLIFVTLFLIPFNILIYTYGIQVISIEKQSGFLVKKIINPGVIACIAAIVIYFVPTEFPNVITETIMMLSKVTAPLSMMIMGASLMDINVKELFLDKSLWAFSLIKMLFLPVVLLVFLKQFITNRIWIGVLMVLLASPVASMIPMLANQYNEEKYELATKGVSLTTVLSVVTMPLVAWLTGIA